MKLQSNGKEIGIPTFATTLIMSPWQQFKADSVAIFYHALHAGFRYSDQNLNNFSWLVKIRVFGKDTQNLCKLKTELQIINLTPLHPILDFHFVK